MPMSAAPTIRAPQNESEARRALAVLKVVLETVDVSAMLSPDWRRVVEHIGRSNRIDHGLVSGESDTSLCQLAHLLELITPHRAVPSTAPDIIRPLTSTPTVIAQVIGFAAKAAARVQATEGRDGEIEIFLVPRLTHASPLILRTSALPTNLMDKVIGAPEDMDIAFHGPLDGPIPLLVSSSDDLVGWGVNPWPAFMLPMVSAQYAELSFDMDSAVHPARLQLAPSATHIVLILPMKSSNTRGLTERFITGLATLVSTRICDRSRRSHNPTFTIVGTESLKVHTKYRIDEVSTVNALVQRLVSFVELFTHPDPLSDTPDPSLIEAVANDLHFAFFPDQPAAA